MTVSGVVRFGMALFFPAGGGGHPPFRPPFNSAHVDEHQWTILNSISIRERYKL
jgi:hypothetical protein